MIATRDVLLRVLAKPAARELASVFGWALSAALFGLVSVDAMTLVTVSLVLALVALCAAYVPARRTLRLDPTTILRA